MIDFTRLDNVKKQRPLVHCVSNIVTATDCANLALAVGASPMMAQAPQEMADITAISDATVLNTGTPDEEKFQVCMLCGKEAARLGRPVVLDPVGVGACPWRLERTCELLHLFTPSILRVNLGRPKPCPGMPAGNRGWTALAPLPGPSGWRRRSGWRSTAGPWCCCPGRRISSPMGGKPGASPAAAA